MKTNEIFYWIATGLLCLLMLASAGMYLFNYQPVAQIFVNLGHPTHVIIPLAIAKILGVIAILTSYSRILKEWAYAGFFFDFILAFMAHFYAGDGGIITPIVAIILLMTSYYFDKKIYK